MYYFNSNEWAHKILQNGGKNMSFMVKDNDALDKYNEIWDKINKRLNIKFHSTLVYNEKYIKVKVREFEGVIKTNILGNKIPKENKHYTCIAYLTIDSVTRMETTNYPQVYSGECKYKIKKKKMNTVVEAELESDSESGSESESKSDTELMANLEFGSNSE